MRVGSLVRVKVVVRDKRLHNAALVRSVERKRSLREEGRKKSELQSSIPCLVSNFGKLHSTMSEWWVSQAKYFCPICKSWMSDNKMSRQMHDGNLYVFLNAFHLFLTHPIMASLQAVSATRINWKSTWLPRKSNDFMVQDPNRI